MPKSISYTKLEKLLRKHSKEFRFYKNRGKGGHRMIYHPNINGHERSYPVPFHAGKDLSPGILNGIIRRFNLPKGFFN